MFESAELGHKIDKATYDRRVPALREALLDAQFELVQKKQFPVIVLIGGVDGAGKGETVNLLHEWMDARHIQSHAMGEPTDEERDRPGMWQFWRRLPPKGTIGIFFGSWYTAPIIQRVYGDTRRRDLDASLQEIVRFERMLVNEGALVLKFWFHLSKKVQKKRLHALERNKETRWRVTKTDWKHFKLYDKFRKVSEYSLRETSTGEAPWVVIEGTDPRYRGLTAGSVLLKAMRERLDGAAKTNGHKHENGAGSPLVLAAPTASVDRRDLLRSLDFTNKLDKAEYEKQLAHYQRRLNLLSRHEKAEKIGTAIVFEGNDAAGKGGTIRRISGALDARFYHIVPIAAPTEEERAQPYLWRFWRNIPRRGRTTIFDRSWYGRVLVERVEGFCQPGDWMRAYSEINDFEEQLVRGHTLVVKFWLAVTKEEQLKRFKEREATGFKRFKITDEDWRNRKKWQDYELAVCDMIDRTSTEIAPWTLIPSNDKYFTRIFALRTLCERIEEAL